MLTTNPAETRAVAKSDAVGDKPVGMITYEDMLSSEYARPSLEEEALVHYIQEAF